MEPKNVVSGMEDLDTADDFSVTALDDGYVEVTALASAGDAIDIKELNHYMAKCGFWLAYNIPDARRFQYVNSQDTGV